MFPSLAERLTKRITIAALALAIPLHLYVDPTADLTVRATAALAFAVSLACARRWVRTPLVVSALAAIAPVVLAALTRMTALNVFYTVILAALFGALLPTLGTKGWHLPSLWRLPIAIWALTLSLGWPVMIVREAGLRLGTLRDNGALDTWALLTTPQVESWILYVVITQLFAVLWLDWMYQAGSGIRTPRSDPDPESRIPNPVHGLLLGATVASMVAVVQGTLDMALLNAEPWIGLRRAAGTLLDANAYGAVAALTGPLAFVSLPHLWRRHVRIAQAAALALNWAGAWMSGSRTALLCGAFGTLLLAYEVVRSSARDEAASRNTWALLAGVAVVVLVLVVGAGAIGPVERIRAAGTSARELWSRGGYGTVATRMVRDYPLTGVGIGSFNWMAPDYWRQIANDKLPFDNAQNWWRHQVAELGLIASLPILLWSLWIAWLVFTRRAIPKYRVETQTLRGLLIGIGVASLVGMPTQNPIVLLMFFYCVARFDALTNGRVPDPGSRIPVPAAAWLAGFLIAIGYAGGHLVLARGPLKPIERAARTNRDYIIGTYPSEPLPQGQFRWTRKHATFALAVRSRHLMIRYHIEHPDVSTHPVRLLIATPCQTIVDGFLTDAFVDGQALELPEGQNRVVFETDVSRTWRPADFGKADRRELGLAVEADFLGTPDVVASLERSIPLKPCS
jgi:O-antigen ligase/polysaccharide polymerase Wzy-like membrane protein